MEVSNQILAVLVIAAVIGNYYVMLSFSKALEKAAYLNHRDAMLTLMRELRWLTEEPKEQWTKEWLLAREEAQRVLEDSDESDFDRERAERAAGYMDRDYYVRFGFHCGAADRHKGWVWEIERYD